jgi:EAL domain-containing protein (putative c-di-GMP-specific phosphodiesterase class I)
MPNGFLRTAERFGLSVDIDKWVIVHAIESLAKQRRKDPNLRYAINLSGQTIQPDYNRQQTIPEISMPVSPTELVFMLPLREPETIPLSSKSRTD